MAAIEVIISLALWTSLTVWAWKRGWKAWALLPFGVAFFVALVEEIVVYTSGADSTNEATPAAMFVGLAGIGTLIYMIVKPRRKAHPVVANEIDTPVSPAAKEKFSAPVAIEPATVVAPATRTRLVLPNKYEILINEGVKPLGRNDFDKLVSADDLKYISRQQLLIRSESGRYFIQDLNSANGTKLNTVDITGKGETELRDGDRIEIANLLELTFKATD
jgi:hypothetical protein